MSINPTRTTGPFQVIRGHTRLLLAVTGALGLAIAGSTTASAAPNNVNTFPLDVSCSNGQHATITVLAPAPEQAAVHVVDNTSVIVPTRFQWHVLVTDAAGNIIDESSPPAELVHGNAGRQLDTIQCTFTQIAHHDWPDIGPVTIQVEGTVNAYIPH